MPSLIPDCLLPLQATPHTPITCKVQQVGHFLESVTLYLLTEAWQTGNPFWAELVIVLWYPSGYLSMDRQRLWFLSEIVLSIKRPWQDLCAASYFPELGWHETQAGKTVPQWAQARWAHGLSALPEMHHVFHVPCFSKCEKLRFGMNEWMTFPVRENKRQRDQFLVWLQHLPSWNPGPMTWQSNSRCLVKSGWPRVFAPTSITSEQLRGFSAFRCFPSVFSQWLLFSH